MQRSQRIKEEATKIMQNFFVAIAQANVSLDHIGVDRPAQTRKPQATVADPQFRDAVLRQAPVSDGEYVIAEKKQW